MRTLLLILFILVKSTNILIAQEKIEWKNILLKGNSNLQVEFDFNLTKEEQIVRIQEQIEKEICNGIFPINTTFKIPDKNIESLLLFERYCSNGSPPTGFLGSIIILINKNGQLLLDDEIVDIKHFDQKLQIKVQEYSENYFSNFASFIINWDNETELALKYKVFKSCINSYLILMKKKALKKYNLSIDKLTVEQLKGLKKDLRFALYLRFPTLPPPAPFRNGN